MDVTINLKQFASSVNSIASYIKNYINNVNESLSTKVNEAPTDDKSYVRKNGNWENLTIPEQQIEIATDEEVAKIIEDAFKN
jgi:hypothetical protein